MRHASEIGLIMSYLWMIPAYFLFDWNFSLILFWFFIEFVILLIFYSVVLEVAIRNYKLKYRKSKGSLNIVLGALPLLIMSYAVVGYVSSRIDPTLHFFENNNILNLNEVWYIIGSSIVIYMLRLLQFRSDKREDVLRKNLFYRASFLGVLSIIGLSVGFAIPDHDSIIYFWIILIAIRVVSELFLIRKSWFI